jgi:hypothetical protein
MMRRKRRIWWRRSIRRRIRVLAVLGVIGLAMVGLLALLHGGKPRVDPACRCCAGSRQLSRRA